MGAGLPDFVTINLRDLAAFAEGEEVTLESLKEKNIIKVSGRDDRLPLKVLGTGDISTKLVIKAAAFSESAKSKIEAAGGEAVTVIHKTKWTRAAYEAAKEASK